MVHRYEHHNLLWIDLESPTSDEVRGVMDEFHLDPAVAEELLLPSLKPKVERYKSYLYLILHFPTFKHTHSSDNNQEVDFVIGKNFLITTRYDTIDPLHKFSKIFEVHTILHKEDVGEHAGFLFYHMLRKLYRSIEHELDFMRDELLDIERNIFAGQEREMVESLSKVSRGVRNFKEVTAKHRSVLESFEKESDFFGNNFSYHARTILGQYLQIQNDIAAHADSLTELRETNNSLVSTKQNEIMKTLTIMAFITFPLTLLTSILGMNTDYLPFVGLPGDFWIVVGIMIMLTSIFFIFFKYRKWL
jgi:magnesium transporter